MKKTTLCKRLLSAFFVTALLVHSASGAAEYDPVDPADPYSPPVSGLFEAQQIQDDSAAGQYAVYIAEGFQPCSAGVMILTPDDTTASAFLDSATGQAWQALADREKIAVIVAEPQDGKQWNTFRAAEGRDEGAFLKKVFDTIRNKAGSIDAAFDMDERAFYLVGYDEGGTAAQEFAMQWPAIICGAASVGGADVPEAVMEQLGEEYAYPFAQADSLEGRDVLKMHNREIPVPMWLVGASGDASAAYWVEANDAQPAAANTYVQTVYENNAARVWVTDAASASQITPEVLYTEFLSQVQRFVGNPGGRLEWTVLHTNDGKTGFFTNETTVDGKLRRWLTYVPSSYQQGTEVPLVVAIHGYSSAMTAFTGDSRWQDVAEKNGFIVAFAQGYPTEVFGNIPVPYWNNVWMGLDVQDVTDDVSYFRTLVEQTKSTYSIDDSRVYATGHSNGSCMAWLLALDASDLFAAIAPIGSDMGAAADELTVTEHPVPIWNMKGEYDTDGGAKLEPGSTDGKAIDYWIENNRTSSEPQISEDASGRFLTREYRNADGVPLLRFSEVKNSPHAYLPEQSELIWNDFFTKFTLNADGSRNYEGKLIKLSEASISPDFTDMTNHWAKDAVQNAVSKGWFSGTSATTFSPNRPATRGMVVTVLGRSANASGDAPKAAAQFIDVTTSDYFAPYIGWALENNIASGTSDTTFAPYKNITREQFAVMAANYAKQAQIQLPESPADLTKFSDANTISSWAQEGVEYCVSTGLISGRDNGCLSPKAPLTRAELASILSRLLN